MNRIVFIRALVGLLSAGWLFPLALGGSAYLSFIETAHAVNPPVQSFPHLEFAGQCLWVAVIWLGGVIFAWTYAAIKPPRSAR